MTRDPFNAGISLRLLVSTKKILGTRAGTFATRGRDYTSIPLIYIDLLKIYGGERGIRTLDRGLTYTPLAGERLQPLGHLSGGCIVAHSTGVLSIHLVNTESKS